ncbi:MAG: hypothetical protein R3257_02105, partial [bacterium]|nr:hypothetical protein [bacterium]
LKGWKAPLRIVGDGLAETGEETVDATLRAKFEDMHAVIGFDQFREIALASLSGGFAKTGTVAEILRGAKTQENKGNAPNTPTTKDFGFLGMVLGVGLGGLPGPKPKIEKSPKAEKDLSLFQETVGMGRAHGYYNPVLRHLPILYPLVHPKNFHDLWFTRVNSFFLQPYQSGKEWSDRDLLLLLPRLAAFVGTMAVLETLSLPLWALSLPFQTLHAWEHFNLSRKHPLKGQKLLQGLQFHKLDDEFLNSEEVGGDELKIEYEDYKVFAYNFAWDVQMVMAQALQDASMGEVEGLLEQAFSSDTKRAMDFLSRYPIRGSRRYALKAIRDFSLWEHERGYSTILKAGKILKELNVKSQSNLDYENHPGINPIKVLLQGSDAALTDAVILQGLEQALEDLQEGVPPKEFPQIPAKWYFRPALKAPLIRFWAMTQQREKIPTILSALEIPATEEVRRAAIFATQALKISRAKPVLLKNTKNGESATLKAAAWRALRNLEGDPDNLSELQKLSPPVRRKNEQAPLNKLWEAMGGNPSSGLLQIGIKDPYRLDMAKALLSVGKEYGVVEYQIDAGQSLLGILLFGEGSLRQKALWELLQVEGNPIARLLKVDPESHSGLKFRLRETKEFLKSVLLDPKTPFKSRLALTKLLWDEISSEEIKSLFWPLLDYPPYAPLAAKTLNEIAPGWDEAIQNFRNGAKVLNFPYRSDKSQLRFQSSDLNIPEDEDRDSNPEDSGPSHMALFPPLLGTVALGNPWDSLSSFLVGASFLALGALGMAMQKKGKRKRKRVKEWVEEIKQKTTPFFQKIDSETRSAKSFLIERLKERQDFNQNYLLQVLEDLWEFQKRGEDPIIIFHNTGSSYENLIRLFSGEGQGDFPFTVHPAFSLDPDYRTRALKIFALERSTPNFTLEIKLPASQVTRWIMNNINPFLKRDPRQVTNYFSMPASLFPSLMREAAREGSVRILGIPHRWRLPKAERMLLGELVSLGVSPTNLIIPEGPDFETLLSLSFEEQWEILDRWSSMLDPAQEVQREAYLNAWEGLILASSEKSISWQGTLGEFSMSLERLARRHHLPRPPSQLWDGILYERIRSKKIGSLETPRLSELEGQIPYPSLRYLFEDFHNTESDRRVSPFGFYQSISRLLRVSLPAWFARQIQRSEPGEIKAERALEILFGDLPPLKRSLEEIQWITRYRVRPGVSVLRRYLRHSNREIRVKALEGLMSLRPSTEISELTDLLTPFLGNTRKLKKLLPREIAEVRLIMKAMAVLGVPLRIAPRAENYLRVLMNSKHEGLAPYAEAAALRLEFLSRQRDYRVDLNH